MAYLSTGDLKKEASAGPYAGSSRADCIRYMIRDKVKFYSNANGSGPGFLASSVVFSKGDKAHGEVFYTKGKQTLSVKTSKLYKAPEMGGGSSGSGAGARATQIQECMQCYVSSYQFNVAKKALKQLPSLADLKKSNVSTYVHADATIEECFDEITQAWIDEEQYIRISNILYNAYKSKFSGKVYFHRGSKFMSTLYANKSAVQKLDAKSKKRQAPGSFSHDKWNPGDIWMSTLSPNDDPLKGCTSWGELKTEVQRLADNGKCLGISLKKLAKAGGKITEYNRTSLPNTKWYKWSWGKTGEFFKSIDIYVTINGVQIQFRNFNKTTSWQGEIKGSSAAGGKIGGGNVNFYLLQEKFNELYSNEASFLNKLKKDETMLMYLWEGYQRHNKNSSPSKKLMSLEDFTTEYNKQDQGFKNSKAICIAFLDSVYSGKAPARDNLATALFNYGSSATEQSSYFIKIS
jgi:hypothetical protein